jgi:N-acetylmuramoyl-L-alanine amidase
MHYPYHMLHHRLKYGFCSLLVLSACTGTPARNPMAEWSPSPNYDVRKPRLIVIHQTEMENAEAALRVLHSQNKQGRVSAHYLIANNGRLYQLVADNERAWHAGVGSWQGVTDINSISIGIELDNNGSEPFEERQILSLIRLLDDLCARFNIPRAAIIGHADLAPTRKKDPSRHFPWQRLAQAGFGQWYDEKLVDAPANFDAVLALKALGYDTSDLPAAVKAFHRHYRGIETDVLDVEDAKILSNLHVRQSPVVE